jgi:hypothetical protein
MALAVVLAAGTAVAQSPPSPHNPPPPTATRPDPRPCVQPRPPIGASKPAPTTGQAPPLSDQLAQGNGVLCPPKGIDPEIIEPAPNVGSTMPVIPPPGTPGGNPTVQPK